MSLGEVGVGTWQFVTEDKVKEATQSYFLRAGPSRSDHDHEINFFLMAFLDSRERLSFRSQVRGTTRKPRRRQLAKLFLSVERIFCPSITHT
jgi:hypothetical protein